MNKIIKTVLDKKEASAVDYFEFINKFDISTLHVQSENHNILSMYINTFEKINNTLKFSQSCTETKYTILESDITSIDGKMLDNMDAFHITIKMKNKLNLDITIFHTDDTKITVKEHFNEIEVEELKSYLNNEFHRPHSMYIADMFSVEISGEKISVKIDEDEENDRNILHVGNSETSFKFDLSEELNQIFFKNGFLDTILIIPFGQPFMHVRIFCKDVSKN